MFPSLKPHVQSIWYTNSRFARRSIPSVQPHECGGGFRASTRRAAARSTRVASPALFRAPSRNASACVRQLPSEWVIESLAAARYQILSTLIKNTHSSSSSSSSRRLILSVSEQRALCDVRIRYGLILGLITLRQGCSPLDDLPQDYSRGNAPRFHWRVSPPHLSPSFSSSLLLPLASTRGFSPSVLSLYHHLPLSFSYYLAIFSPPCHALSFSDSRRRSFLLPACVPFLHASRAYLSLSALFSHSFLLSSFSFSLLQIVPLCSHNFFLSLTGLLCPSFLYPSLSLHHAFFSHSCSLSSSSAHVVLLSHVDQRGCPGGGILTPPGACALHVQLSPFLLIPYLQLFDTRGKDLFGLFCEDRQANNKINLSINFSTDDYVIGQSWNILFYIFLLQYTWRTRR